MEVENGFDLNLLSILGFDVLIQKLLSASAKALKAFNKTKLPSMRMLADYKFMFLKCMFFTLE